MELIKSQFFKNRQRKLTILILVANSSIFGLQAPEISLKKNHTAPLQNQAPTQSTPNHTHLKS
jgi:hypothetical protein